MAKEIVDKCEFTVELIEGEDCSIEVDGRKYQIHGGGPTYLGLRGQNQLKAAILKTKGKHDKYSITIEVKGE